MGLVARYASEDLRRQRRSYVGLTALVAISGALSLFCIAGARRTQSSYPRFLRAAGASTMVVTTNNAYDPVALARTAALPQVVQSRTYVSFEVYTLTDGRPDPSQSFEAVGTFDGEYYDQDRFAPTEGRRPNRDHADEVAVDELAAQKYGYRVGQRLQLGTYDVVTPGGDFFTNPPPPGMTTEVTIVGIGLFPDGVVQDEGDRVPRVLMTPAFTRAAAAYVTYGLQGLVLRNGAADVPAVQRALAAMQPEASLEYQITSDNVEHAASAMRPISIALGAFGLVAGLAGLLLSGQSIARVLRAQRSERAVLRALGASPRSSMLAAMACTVASVGIGAVIAVALAIVASPLMPTGPVRDVEAAPGIDVDATVLPLGALGMIVVLVGATAVLAALEAPQRVALRARRSTRPGRVADAAAGAGAGPATVNGLRFAFEGSATTGDGNRSVMFGATVAVAALVAAITFGASFDHLVERPSLYGWNADAILTGADGYGNIPSGQADAALRSDEDVTAWSGAYFGIGTIDGRGTPLLGMDADASLPPPILSGRMLDGPGEIVVGEATAAQLGKHIGDVVMIDEPAGPVPLTIVGTATFPAIGAVHLAHTALGLGALVEHQLVPNWDSDLTGSTHGDFGPRAIFVRLRTGPNDEAAIARLRQTTASLRVEGGLDVLPVQRPAEITTASTATNLPLLLALLLGVAVVIWLAVAAGTMVRRRAHDLAVMKALGFTRRQLRATIGALAGATAAIGLVVGVPIGVAIGRVLWSHFAADLDVVDEPIVPLLAIVTVVVAALVVALATSARPARRAGRVRTQRLLQPQ